jgi:predicted 3-demethylubiquinone-9 3-methyltransferase (glyoxalase superfamily)
MTPQKIKTFLWYDSAAEQAAEFYCSLFPNSKVHKVTNYPEGAPAPAGSVMTVDFSLAGVQFIALNAGPHFQFTEAISLSVECEDQAEVDHLWNKLTSSGGQESQCGWLKDRWGLSWQITPKRLMEFTTSTKPGVASKAMAAMMTMKKIDIAAIERAAQGA